MCEIILIVAVFSAILVVFLYKYLIQSQEYKAKSTTPSRTLQVMPETEVVAEKVFKLFDKVEDLEETLSNLHMYVSQKVEQSKKKEKAPTETRQ